MVSNALSSSKKSLSQKALCHPPPPPPVEEPPPLVCECSLTPHDWEGGYLSDQPTHGQWGFSPDVPLHETAVCLITVTKGEFFYEENPVNNVSYPVEYHWEGSDPYYATGEIKYTFPNSCVATFPFTIHFTGAPP